MRGIVPGNVVHSRTVSSTPPSGLHSVEWMPSTVSSTPAGGLQSVQWSRASGARYRVRSVAGPPAAVRSGLLRAVRPLVVLAHRVRVGIVLFGVAVRAGAG